MDKFEQLINRDKPVLIDFFAQWCGPCKMMAPILTDIKATVGDKADIVKIDIDLPANKSVVAKYGIRSVPTLILFNKGEAVWRQSGVADAKTLQDIILKNI